MKKKKVFSVSEFKAKALGLFERVSREGEDITITKHGKPLAKVIAVRDAASKPTPGKLEGTVISEEDITTPLGAKLWTSTK